MTIAIMQPYFLPYIGYFQMIKAVDKFVMYDNIKYTKKGWINRNRMLNGNKEEVFSLAVKKDSDYLDIRDRKLSDNYLELNQKTLRRIENYYRKAPFFNEIYPLLETIFLFENHDNLFQFILNSIEQIKTYLQVDTEIVNSSTVNIDHNLKSQEKVIAICKEMKATEYINPIGGVELYNKDIFTNEKIKLNFIHAHEIVYRQDADEFVPWLSVLDVIMWNSKDKVKEMLDQYELI